MYIFVVTTEEPVLILVFFYLIEIGKLFINIGSVFYIKPYLFIHLFTNVILSNLILPYVLSANMTMKLITTLRLAVHMNIISESITSIILI